MTSGRYSVRILPSAQRDLKGIRKRHPREAVRAIDAAILALAADPRPAGSTPLSGWPGRRVRVGDFRIVYDVRDADVIVLVVRVGHRRDVYRDL